MESERASAASGFKGGGGASLGGRRGGLRGQGRGEAEREGSS